MKEKEVIDHFVEIIADLTGAKLNEPLVRQLITERIEGPVGQLLDKYANSIKRSGNQSANRKKKTLGEQIDDRKKEAKAKRDEVGGTVVCARSQCQERVDKDKATVQTEDGESRYYCCPAHVPIKKLAGYSEEG